MQILHTLKQLGFSEKKAKVYLALLELGGGSVIDIAKKVKIKRTTVYNILPELIEDGLVVKSKRQKKTFYLVEDPVNIKKCLETKIELANLIIPQLIDIYQVLPYKPKITFYEGLEGMKKFYQDSLDSLKPGDVILSYTGVANFWQYLPAEWAKDYFQRRTAKRIRIKLIMPESTEAREIQQEAQRYLREVKIVKNINDDFYGDVEIYANKVALISYREDFIGMIIESRDLANLQKMAFELMWKGANI